MEKDSGADRQFMHDHRPLWVGKSPTPCMIHCRNAALEVSLPVSCQSSLSAADPVRSVADWIAGEAASAEALRLRLEGMQESAAKERAEAAAAVANLQKAYAEKEIERSAAFEQAVTGFKDTFTKVQNENAATAAEKLADLDDQRQRAAKIVQVVGNIGVTGNYPLYAANHGIKVTNDIHAVIETLTGYEAAKVHSFAPWNARDPARPIIALSNYRKWCPACYLDDALSEKRIYDRLVWMPKNVELCIHHGTKLESSCLNCGNGSFSFIRNDDIAGYCPKCHAWLGGIGRTYPRDHDELVRYRWWIADCIAEMVEHGLPEASQPFENIATGINAAINHHFDGNGTSTAGHLGRSKSLVSQWRNGIVTPSWDALCEISYAFQTSIHTLLTGDSDAIAFSTLAQLPSQIVLDRPKSIARNRTIDYPTIEKFMLEIIGGKHPTITRFRQIGEQFQIDRTTPKKHVPELAAQVEDELKKRREKIRVHRENRRLASLREEVMAVTVEFMSRNQAVRRRPLVEELTRRGWRLGYEDYIWTLAMAKNIANHQPMSVQTAQTA